MHPTLVLSHEFRHDVRDRGEAYVRSGRVRLVEGDDHHVTAIVEGSEIYDVRISRMNDGTRVRFDASCSCAFLRDRLEPCKHIWATLRAAENRTLLGTDDGDPRSAHLVCHLPDRADEDLAEDEHDAPAGIPAPPAPVRPARTLQPPEPPSPSTVFLNTVEMRLLGSERDAGEGFPYPDSTLLYVIDGPASTRTGVTVLTVMHQRRKKNEGYTKPKAAKLSSSDIALAPEHDRRLLALLSGATRTNSYSYWSGYAESGRTEATFSLSAPLTLELLPVIARTARAWIRPRSTSTDIEPLAWDDGPPWMFELHVGATETGYRIDGAIARGDLRVPVSEPFTVLANSLIAVRGRLARFDGSGGRFFVPELVASGPIQVPREEGARLAHVLARSGAAAANLPDELRVTTYDAPPIPRLHVRQPPFPESPNLVAQVAFDYGGMTVSARPLRASAFDPDRRRLIRRHAQDEERALDRIGELGGRPTWQHEQQGTVEVPARAFPVIARTLAGEGWIVEAAGERYRASTGVRLSVSSGIDWFDLTGTVAFGDTTMDLPRVLAALKSGVQTIRLDDGTVGVLPETWLRRYLTLASVGDAQGTRIRFGRAQAALLDVLLAEREAEADVVVDETFSRVREALAGFSQVRPLDPPATFTGVLRPYQREGLGWFAFLREFGFGGCLADDMGLGKTIMVLALLDSRRRAGGADEPHRPSLIVVPRSLIGNWMDEAARFTPALRVLDQSHGARTWAPEMLADQDVILVTYGTLRRDIAAIQDLRFDYVVLDEAQAIKNAGTSAAKAVRLLRAGHRLALSGTPIENHLGELWSLFEFLNPGVLGRSTVFHRALKQTTIGSDGETATLLSRALRPFILRRTKAQVARELPARTEQTISCELSAGERALYDGLRKHYREALLSRVERVGLSQSRFQVLEALLRLRQAACHPALVDATGNGRHGGSAKFDVLLPRLVEVIEEGHSERQMARYAEPKPRQVLDRQRIGGRLLHEAEASGRERLEGRQSGALSVIHNEKLQRGRRSRTRSSFLVKI
jgi:hypothetical protein